MKTIVVGLGNPFFGNDSAGIRVAEMVEKSEMLNTDVVCLSTTSFEVIDRILGYNRAFIVDTIRGEKPGRVHVFHVDELNETAGNLQPHWQVWQSHHTYASHAITLTESLRVGYELFPDKMPNIEIIAIEIVDAEPGTECSEEVEEAIERAFHLLRRKITEADV